MESPCLLLDQNNSKIFLLEPTVKGKQIRFNHRSLVERFCWLGGVGCFVCLFFSVVVITGGKRNVR